MKHTFDRLVKLGQDNPELRDHISPILHHVQKQARRPEQVDPDLVVEMINRKMPHANARYLGRDENSSYHVFGIGMSTSQSLKGRIGKIGPKYDCGIGIDTFVCREVETFVDRLVEEWKDRYLDQGGPARAGAPDQDVVEELRDQIEFFNYGPNEAIEETADKLNMSPDHVRSVYRKHFKQSSRHVESG